jgi:hypothetical protein
VVSSVSEEYQWVRANCPGFKVEKQTLGHVGEKPFDLLHLRSESGETRDVFFDISSFFGR